MQEQLRHNINQIRRPGQTHIYLPSHPLLRPYIAHYTLIAAAEPFEKKTGFNVESAVSGVVHRDTPPAPDSSLLTLIPDASGCLVFTFDDASGWTSKFWGPTTKTVTVKKDFDEVPLRVFVEFLPCGAYFLMGQPLSELADLSSGLETIDSALSSRLCALLEEFASIPDLTTGLDHFFLDRLFSPVSTSSVHSSSDFVLPLLSHIQKQNGLVSMKELSILTAYSERHLSRLLLPALGIHMKSYTRLLRINQALQELKSAGSGLSLTDLAHRLGYFDQSHFNRDFKIVCGVTPALYQKNVSDFYNETFKF